MVYQTDPHLARARDHIESNDADRLLYACLELRFALERIAYQKLRLRLDRIAIEEIGIWQPRRAMDRLMELVDEHLEQDATLSIALEKHGATPAENEYSPLVQVKGVSPKLLGRHWQKLSSFLHVRMPRKKDDHIRAINGQELRTYLLEAADYVEELTRTRSDFLLSETVTFACGKCHQSIVRNRKLLKQDSVVQCQNPNCSASYVTHVSNGEYGFKPYQLPITCKNEKCKQIVYIEANVFLRMKTDEGKIYVCDECGTRHLVRWILKYALEADADREG